MIAIRKLKPAPVILGTVIVFLAVALVDIEAPVLRLQVSDVAVFLSVLFFYVLQREDIKKLEKKVEKLEELV